MRINQHVHWPPFDRLIAQASQASTLFRGATNPFHMWLSGEQRSISGMLDRKGMSSLTRESDSF